MSTPAPHSVVGGVDYNVTTGDPAAAAISTDHTASQLQSQLEQLKTFVIGLEDV